MIILKKDLGEEKYPKVQEVVFYAKENEIAR